jgi:hypothetical protein
MYRSSMRSYRHDSSLPEEFTVMNWKPSKQHKYVHCNQFISLCVGN